MNKVIKEDIKQMLEGNKEHFEDVFRLIPTKLKEKFKCDKDAVIYYLYGVIVKGRESNLLDKTRIKENNINVISI